MSKRARETEQVGLFLIGKVVTVVHKPTAISAKIEILFMNDVQQLVREFEWPREMSAKPSPNPLAKVPVYPWGKDKTRAKTDILNWLTVPSEVWLLVQKDITEGMIVLLPRFRANLNEKGDKEFYRSDDPRPIEMGNHRKIVLPTRAPMRVVDKDTPTSMPENRSDPIWLFFGKDEARVAVANARASLRTSIVTFEPDGRDTSKKTNRIRLSFPAVYTDAVTGTVYTVQANVCLLHHLANLPQTKHATESYMMTPAINATLTEIWTTFVESLFRLPGVTGVTGLDDESEHAMACTTLTPEAAACTYHIKAGTLAVRDTILNYLLPVSESQALEIYKTLPQEFWPYPTELKADLSALLFCAMAPATSLPDDTILKTAAGKLYVLPLPSDGNYAAVAALKQTKRREADGVVTFDPFTKEEIDTAYGIAYTLVAYSRRDDDTAMSVVRERWENCRKYYLSNRSGADEPPADLADE